MQNSLLNHISEPRAQRAWVVFSGQADLPWLKILKPGFRHCFCLLHDGEHWITLDPLSGHMDVRVQDIAPGFDLPGWLESRGYRVCEAPMQAQHKQAPIALMSCVEAVKRIIGLHDIRVITPYQLFKHLTKGA